MHLIIHTDGGSRGNPGPAASAFTAHNGANELLHREQRYLGDTTNNVAEYTALVMALEWVHQQKTSLEIESVDVLMDSELVVKQMRGEYKIRDERLRSLATRVKELERDSKVLYKYVHVLRGENSLADSLVNAAMDAEQTKISSTGN